MSSVAPIECVGDLPCHWQGEWHKCRAAYVRQFQHSQSIAWAERKAFEDIRDCYLDKMAAVAASSCSGFRK